MEFLILAFEALRERKVRTAFTVLMVVIGVAMLIAVDSISAGTHEFIEGEFRKFGTNIIVVNPTDEHPELTDRDINQLKQLDGVQDVIPFVAYAAKIESRGESKDTFVYGMDLSKVQVVFPGLKLIDGTWPTPIDTVGIVVGYSIAFNEDGTVFAYTRSAVTITIVRYAEGKKNFVKKNLVIRGVLESYGSFVVPVDQMVFMPLKPAQKLFDRTDYDGAFVVAVNDDIAVNVSKQIKKQFGLRAVAAKALKDIIDSVLGAFSLYIGSISAISLIVASIGIITTLYTSMLERIREIGILKAIGYQKSHILRMFLYEAILIGIMGAVLGSIMGVLAAYGLKMAFFRGIKIGQEVLVFPIEPRFTVYTFVKANTLAVFLSLLSGLYPAWRASQLDPIVALRYE